MSRGISPPMLLTDPTKVTGNVLCKIGHQKTITILSLSIPISACVVTPPQYY